MARQGRAGSALGIAAIGSFVGGTLATVALVVVAMPLATLALKFGPAEFFALMVAGLCLVVGLAGKNILAALLMTVIGLLLAMIGLDPVRGAPRFTFGIEELFDGIGFVPVVMGLFGVAELLLAAETAPDAHDRGRAQELDADAPGDARQCVGAIGRGTGGRLRARPDPRRRRHRADLHGLRAGEARLQDAGALRQGRDRGRRLGRDRQQRLCQRRDGAAAGARHPELAHHRGADGRLHHQRHHARALPVHRSSRRWSGR